MLGFALWASVATDNWLSDVWYDSAKGVVAYGGRLVTQTLTGSSHFFFGTLREGRSTLQATPFEPSVVVSESHFVTHASSAALVEASTSESKPIGRSIVLSSSGGFVYFRDMPRTANSLGRQRPGSDEIETVATLLAPGDLGTVLDLVEGSVDGKTVAWAHGNVDGYASLDWIKDRSRRAIDARFVFAAVSATGKLIYLVERDADDHLRCIAADSGETLWRTAFVKGSIAAIAADESSDDVVVVVGDDWNAHVVDTQGRTKAILGSLAMRPADRKKLGQ